MEPQDAEESKEPNRNQKKKRKQRGKKVNQGAVAVPAAAATPSFDDEEDDEFLDRMVQLRKQEIVEADRDAERRLQAEAIRISRENSALGDILSRDYIEGKDQNGN